LRFDRNNVPLPPEGVWPTRKTESDPAVTATVVSVDPTPLIEVPAGLVEVSTPLVATSKL
jgi:hypothetical protein